MHDLSIYLYNIQIESALLPSLMYNPSIYLYNIPIECARREGSLWDSMYRVKYKISIIILICDMVLK